MGGCMSSSNVSQNTIIMQVNKMRIAFQNQQKKCEAKAKQKFEQFQSQLKKPNNQRNKDIQKIILQQIVIFNNKRHIYNLLENDCKKIIDNKHFVGNPAHFNIIIPNIREIFFADSILNDENIKTFKSFVKTKYPEITQSQINDIQSDILKHHKMQENPTDTMVNDFVLLACQKNEMNLQIINASGNQFRYGG